MSVQSSPTRPLNLGHRGALSLAPENTLAAFAQARAVGADGIEFDVQLSKDGQLVIMHDDSLKRTTDGEGFVADRTLAELKALDAGQWFDAQFAGERIPTLQEVFDLVDTQMLLNIELKGKSERVTERQTGVESKVVECVRRNQRVAQVIVSSFNWVMLERVRQLEPAIRIGLLYRQPIEDWQLTTFNAEAIHPEWRLVDERLVEQAHARGQQVNVWTVNEEEDLRRMIALGVDAIITNFPQRLKQILDGTAKARR